MKNTIFIVTSELGEALNLGIKLNHLNKANHRKMIIDHSLYPPHSTYTVRWGLNLRANSIIVLHDVPSRIKALVNLNKPRYQPQKIIILK